MKINQINKYLFNRLIHVTHWLTEKESRNWLGKPVSRALGTLTLGVKQGAPKTQLLDAAKEWQRMFPSKKMVPIVSANDDVVIAEIHSECPYRGSGNVHGCFRMMEYDRKLMEVIGADFVVLQSQAEPGVINCRVAISRDSRNLVPAHVRVIATDIPIV